MPKIPQAESRATISTVSPTRRVGKGAFAGSSQVIQALGKTLSTVTNRFKKAQVLNETTKAETLASRRLKELEIEAEQSPDVFDIESFQKRFNDIRQEANKEITSAGGRESFANSFDRMALMSDFSIRKILRKRQVDELTATMFERIDSLETDPNRSAELNLLLDKNVSGAVINKVDAFKLKAKTLKAWQESDIRNAIATDVEEAKKDILAGDFGDLSADETAKWLQVANQKEKRNKSEAETKLKTKWFQGNAKVIGNAQTLQVKDLVSMVANNEINPKVADAIIDWKLDKKSIPFGEHETDKELWISLAENSVSLDVDLLKFQESLAKSLSEGRIDAIEAKEFSEQIEKMFGDAKRFKSKQDRNAKNLQSSIQMFKASALFGVSPVAGTFVMTKELIRRIKEGGVTGDKILEEAVNIVEEQQANVNPNKARYKVGDQIDTPGGTVQVTGFDVDGEPLIKIVE